MECGQVVAQLREVQRNSVVTIDDKDALNRGSAGTDEAQWRSSSTAILDEEFYNGPMTGVQRIDVVPIIKMSSRQSEGSRRVLRSLSASMFLHLICTLHIQQEHQR